MQLQTQVFLFLASYIHNILACFKYPILPFALLNFLIHTSYVMYDITVLFCITTFFELWISITFL